MSIPTAHPGIAPVHEAAPASPPRTASVRDDQQLNRSGVSRATWRQVTRGVTIAVFAVATAAGVHLGLQGPAVSPVAPLAATASAVTQAPPVDGSTGGVDRGRDGPGAGVRAGTDDGDAGGGRR